jgi:DNA-binding transcriptional LysR family regulator
MFLFSVAAGTNVPAHNAPQPLHLHQSVAVGEEQHYGRAAQRLRMAQPNLEGEIGFRLFERLPRGVKINAAGTLFLEEARRILQQVNEATMRA